MNHVSGSRKPYETKPCVWCGVPFGPKPRPGGSHSWNDWRRQSACSHSCGQRARGGGRGKPYEEKPCEVCSTPFGPYAQATAGFKWAQWGRARFCSRPCGQYARSVERTIAARPVIDRHGYASVHCPWHPRARINGLVFEHIVVMERTLRRLLLPGENVHHINGLRADNRPENLELWVSMQPSGQRPADLVRYAHEILARYMPEGLDRVHPGG